MHARSSELHGFHFSRARSDPACRRVQNGDSPAYAFATLCQLFLITVRDLMVLTCYRAS